jgi:aminoglycoside phosphotransferase (APT) family kinase protein
MLSAAQLEEDLAARRVELGGAMHLNPVPSPYSTSYPLHDLTVLREDGARLALVVKDLAWASMLPEARRTKPRFLYDPAREVGVYQRLLNHEQLGTPRCYAAVARVDARPWILLERVPGVPLVEVGDREAWLRAMRWVARFHADSGTHRVGHEVPLLRHDECFYRTWMDRAQQFVLDDRLTWVAERYDTIVERLLAQPATFIHGELYASNVLIDGERVCPIDWEMAGIGPALVDVAALTAGRGWSDADEMAMLRAYRDDFDEDRLADLDACRAYLAIQWLGWSASWTPPIERAQDWLAVAAAATERLVGRP